MNIVINDALFIIGGFLLAIGMYLAVRYKDVFSAGTSSIPLIALTFLANLIPFALLTYGFAGDFINQEFIRLSAPSIGAFLAMLLVGLGTQAYAGTSGIDLSAQDTSGLLWCTIPGMENAESPWIPTAFISTTTIAAYYTFWAWHTNRPYWSMLGGFIGVLVIQMVAFSLGSCSDSYLPLMGRGGAFVNIVVAIMIGIGVALITYLSTSLAGGARYDPFPTSTTAAPAGGTSGGTSGGSTQTHLSKCPDGSVPIDGKCPYKAGHSQQVQDTENTFVAELYKNGQLVTDSIAA